MQQFSSLYRLLYATMSKNKLAAVVALLASLGIFGASLLQAGLLPVQTSKEDRYCPGLPKLKAVLDELRGDANLAILFEQGYDAKYDEPFEYPLCQSTEPGAFPLPITKYFIPATARGIQDHNKYRKGQCVTRLFESTETWAIGCPVFIGGKYKFRLSIEQNDKQDLPASLSSEIAQLKLVLPAK